jgi:hypothetical protein
MVSRKGSRLVGFAVGLSLVGLLGTAIGPSPAFADPPAPNAASPYEVNVPSSVLAAAAVGGGSQVGGGTTDAEIGGMLANTTQFNQAWKAFVEEYGPELEGASTADQATIASMEAQFAAPATTVGGLTKLVGDVALPVTAVFVGFSLGPSFDSAVGIDDDPGLCEGGASDAAGTIIANLTNTNCPQWQMTQAFQDQRNTDANPVVSGGTTCSLSVPTDCANIVGSTSDPDLYCVHLEGPGTVWFWRSDNSTITISDTTAGGSGLVAGTGTGCSDTGNDGSGNFELAAPDFGPGPTNLPIKSYCVGDQSGGFVDNCGLPSPEQVTTTPGDPERKFRCTATMTDGSTFSQDSGTFFESDSSIPRPEAPAIPAGKIPEGITCSELGGPSPNVVVPPTATTTPYQQWAENYGYCTNGSCALDLQKDGASCFTGDTDCDGWVDDPTRDSDYTCLYDGVSIGISECFIYGTTFNTDDRANGNAYANPATGEITEGQTSPSSRDVAVAYCTGAYDNTVTDSSDIYGQYLGMTRTSWNNLCKTEPIFLTGDDTPGASAHDLQAIAENPARMFLTYATSAEKPRPHPAWYNNDPTCVAAHANGLDCDEFPFWSTEQGEDGLHQLGAPSLAGVTGIGDNRLQGQRLGTFYHNPLCFPTTSARDSTERDYIVVAVPLPFVPTTGICVP